MGTDSTLEIIFKTAYLLKRPIGGEICLWHRAGHGGRVWCINNQSSRRGAGAQHTLFSTHQRSLLEWGHCKSAPLLLLQPHIAYCHEAHILCLSRFLMSEMGWFLRVDGGGERKNSGNKRKRNSTDLVAPHLHLLYHSPLSCKTLCIIEPDFPAVWMCL